MFSKIKEMILQYLDKRKMRLHNCIRIASMSHRGRVYHGIQETQPENPGKAEAIGMCTVSYVITRADGTIEHGPKE